MKEDLYHAHQEGLMAELQPGQTLRVSIDDVHVPVLEHALVLESIGRDDGLDCSEAGYRRVGLAEVNCGWMTGGVRTVVRLF